MKSGVRVTVDKMADLAKAMRALTGREVACGIPADKSDRTEEDGEAVTNAQLGYIHEMGSPARNIPARAFVVPGIRAAQEKIVDQLRDAANAALGGQVAGVDAALNRAGIIAMNSVKAQFVDNDWEPLADATLDKRPPAQRDENGQIVRKGKSRRERGKLNPLIDTSQLRKA
ncbi:hypothetical protein, partial [Pseudodesulfovibrio pelocollis]|uniref:hypothetical protein n=1 Tax=Pseudodesulfovibrio pelocollis TaxID=3051432 RepID=UPI00255B1EB7